jgi:hypothetical protein
MTSCGGGPAGSVDPAPAWRGEAMRRRIVAQLVLAILAAGCGRQAPVDYTSPDGRYRVQFTGKPKLQEQTVPTVLGPITAKIASTEDWSGTLRRVMYADYPAHPIRFGNKDAILDGACQGMATEGQLLISNKLTIAINGHPGRDVRFESQPVRSGAKISGRARVYLVGNRLYQVFIAGRSDRMESESMEEFLNSFALLDQGPMAAAPDLPIGPPPIGPTPDPRPGPAAPRPGRQTPPPNPRVRPGPKTDAPLAFYNIPEPAATTIEADIPGMGATPADRPPGSGVSGLGGSPAPAGRSSVGGASIRSFAWLDADADVVGGSGDAARADGTKDQHFQLELDLPPNSIIESVVIDCGGGNHWVTQPSDRYWPIAIFQARRPVCRSHVAQVGDFSGAQSFDLHVNTGGPIGPGTRFDLEVVVSIDGNRVTLTSQCKRPEGTGAPLAAARPSAMPQPAAPGPGPAVEPDNPPQVQPQAEDRPARREAESNEVPTLLKASGGGATIVSFDWIDQTDDVVGISGRLIAPGGGKDEHFRLVMDLPAAAMIETFTITGGGVLRWTTGPSPKYWPVAVVANHELKNRAQRLRLGAFSGHYTFDLYVESHPTVRPGQAFGVEVVVLIGGIRHHLTARCQRR